MKKCLFLPLALMVAAPAFAETFTLTWDAYKDTSLDRLCAAPADCIIQPMYKITNAAGVVGPWQSGTSTAATNTTSPAMAITLAVGERIGWIIKACRKADASQSNCSPDSPFVYWPASGGKVGGPPSAPVNLKVTGK